jgi:MOSC domain-containing protein YiiM
MSSHNPGRVASLHLHPDQAGEPMRAAESFAVVAEKGIEGNGRYFARISRSTGQPGKRQLSLMEREQIAGHAAALGLPAIPAGAVRANIETTGIDLIALIGCEVQIGDAILCFYEARTPCEKMDRICQGLRTLMENRKQGVLAQVIRGGTIRVGDLIHPS